MFEVCEDTKNEFFYFVKVLIIRFQKRYAYKATKNLKFEDKPAY